MSGGFHERGQSTGGGIGVLAGGQFGEVDFAGIVRLQGAGSDAGVCLVFEMVLPPDCNSGLAGAGAGACQIPRGLRATAQSNHLITGQHP